MSMLPEEIDLNNDTQQEREIQAEIDKLLGKQVEWANRQGSNSLGYVLPNFCGNVPADVIPNVMKKINVQYGEAYHNVRNKLFGYACEYKKEVMNDNDTIAKLKTYLESRRSGGYRKKRSRSKSSKKRKSFSVKRKNQRKKSRKGRTSRKGRKSRK
jgi:hypothetical protein